MFDHIPFSVAIVYLTVFIFFVSLPKFFFKRRSAAKTAIRIVSLTSNGLIFMFSSASLLLSGDIEFHLKYIKYLAEAYIIFSFTTMVLYALQPCFLSLIRPLPFLFKLQLFNALTCFAAIRFLVASSEWRYAYNFIFLSTFFDACLDLTWFAWTNPTSNIRRYRDRSLSLFFIVISLVTAKTVFMLPFLPIAAFYCFVYEEATGLLFSVPLLLHSILWFIYYIDVFNGKIRFMKMRKGV